MIITSYTPGSSCWLFDMFENRFHIGFTYYRFYMVLMMVMINSIIAPFICIKIPSEAPGSHTKLLEKIGFSFRFEDLKI